jgi:predicted peptidase
MLWSQISVKCSEKYGVFIIGQSYDQIFTKSSSILSKKAAIFAPIFLEKTLKNYNIDSNSLTVNKLISYKT